MQAEHDGEANGEVVRAQVLGCARQSHIPGDLQSCLIQRRIAAAFADDDAADVAGSGIAYLDLGRSFPVFASRLLRVVALIQDLRGNALNFAGKTLDRRPLRARLTRLRRRRRLQRGRRGRGQLITLRRRASGSGR